MGEPLGAPLGEPLALVLVSFWIIDGLMSFADVLTVFPEVLVCVIGLILDFVGSLGIGSLCGLVACLCSEDGGGCGGGFVGFIG